MKLIRRITPLIFILVLVVMTGFAHGASVRVSWNANSESDLGGYKVYYGTRSETYANVQDVGMVTSADVEGLSQGRDYYFAVTAYDVSGNESGFSNEASIVIPSDGTSDPGDDDPIVQDPSLPDTDMDGIPDEYEDLWGLDPYDAFDSLLDDDGDGVVNLVEYLAGTSPVDSGEFPLSDGVLKDMIGELGEIVDFSSINPNGDLSIVPLTEAFPEPVSDTIRPQSAGTYLYNVRAADSSLVYRLRVSVTEMLTVMGDYEPGLDMGLTDQISGIRVDVPANALTRAVPIGIGNVVPESVSAVYGEEALKFDVLPFGLLLSKPAVVTVACETRNPAVERYDSLSDSWVGLEETPSADGTVSFSTDELGTFRVLSAEAGDAPSSDGGGGGGGGCFIQAAGF
jgi:hypothetical protein